MNEDEAPQITAHIATAMNGVRWRMRCEFGMAYLMRNGYVVHQRAAPCPQGANEEMALLDRMIAEAATAEPVTK